MHGVVSYVIQNWGGVRGWRLEPVEVSAFMDNAGKKVDINAVVSVRFKGGAVGTLNTLGNAPRHDERIAIHESTGCIVFHLHQWQIQAVLINGAPMTIPSWVWESRPDETFFSGFGTVERGMSRLNLTCRWLGFRRRCTGRWSGSVR